MSTDTPSTQDHPQAGASRLGPVERRLLKPWIYWAATVAIAGRNRSRTDASMGRFTRADVDRLLTAALANFDHHSTQLPGEPTLGARQNVILAALTLSMLRALTAEGIERDYAIELIGDCCWKIYSQWGQLPRTLSRLITRDPVRRMQLSVDMFLWFPFNRPGYQYDDITEPRGRGLDMLRCPVADYLTANDAADLCVTTWCNLDYALAHKWGGTLERHGTLATGANRCDFRFRANTGSRPQRRFQQQPSVDRVLG